ncbi:MAG TPA: hypothetical protein VMU05_10875, partial [Dongiaceae bacterium]|nr:hypothetical protein [Dongiaceae bacterium]
MFSAVKYFLFPVVLGFAIAHAQCPVDTVIVKGRVEQAPHNSRVRAQLIFGKDQPGASAEASLENGAFRLPIEFLTQSSHPILTNL